MMPTCRLRHYAFRNRQPEVAKLFVWSRESVPGLDDEPEFTHRLAAPVAVLMPRRRNGQGRVLARMLDITSQQPSTPGWDASLVSPSISQLSVAVLTGGSVGAAISVIGREPMTQDVAVWAVVATGLTAAAGVVAANGWMSWRALRQPGPRASSRERGLLAAVVFTAVLFGFAGYVLPTGEPSTRGVLLLGAAIVGGIPALMAIGAIHARVMAIETSDGASAVDSLGGLRLVLTRQLRGLGALVALATLALAISPGLGSMFTEAQDGSGAVLVLGGVGSAIVAMAYLPVAIALRNRVYHVTLSLLPVAANDEADVVLARLRGRQDLMKLVLGERGVYDELLASLVVAGPLITAAVGRVVAT